MFLISIQITFAVTQEDLEPFRLWHISFETNLTKDDSINDNLGQVKGNPILTMVDCQVGTSCADFDGTDDGLNFSSIPPYETGFNWSVTFWLKMGNIANPNVDTILGRNNIVPLVNGIWVIFNDDRNGENSIKLQGSGAIIQSVNLPNVELETSTWTCISYSFNTTNKATGANAPTGYVNGTIIASTTSSGWILNTENILVGIRADGDGEFTGFLDEMIYWNKSLTQEEVQFICDLGATGTTFGIVDTTPPSFLTDSINDTDVRRNDVVNVSIDARDETALGSVILAHNISGTLTNVSSVTASGTEFNASFEFQVDLIRGHQVAYQFTINDSAGNTNQTGLFQFEVQNTPAPTATILFPAPNGLITFLQPLDINVTFPADPDLDGLRIDYYIDDVLNQSSFTNTTFNASDATYTLKVSIDDGLSASTNVSVQFTIDTVNPIVTINNPQNNSLHSLDIPVDLVCTNINLQNLSYVFFNSSDILQEEFNATTDVTESILNIPISITALSDGFYNFNVTCTDNASLSAVQFLILELDQTNPGIVTAISNNTPAISSLIQINSTCTDTNGISLFAVANNVSGTLTNVTTVNIANSTPFLFLFNHTVVSTNQTIAHQFTCEDAVNNPIQSALILYTSHTPPTDTSPPTVDSTGISNSTPREDDVIRINVTCTDTFSGISRIEVANNVTGLFANVTSGTFNNDTTVAFTHNHTVEFGFIAHQFTCTDGSDNSIQSSFVNYNSTALPTVPIITALVTFPLENAGSLIGMIALFLIILGVLGFTFKRRKK